MSKLDNDEYMSKQTVNPLRTRRRSEIKKMLWMEKNVSIVIGEEREITKTHNTFNRQTIF